MASPTPARYPVSDSEVGNSARQPPEPPVAKETAIPLGQRLVHAGLISPEQLAEALRLQEEWGSRLGDLILAMGWVKPLDFYRVLAYHFDLEFVNLMEEPADDSLFDHKQYAEYAQHLYLPWRRRKNGLWIATADPSSTVVKQLSEQPGIRLVVTSKFDIIWELQRVAGPSFSRQAVGHLSRFDPERSAKVVITPEQKRGFVLLMLCAFASLWFFPVKTAIVLNALINIFLFLSFAFRTLLCWMSCSDEVALAVSPEEVAALRDTELPVYSILVPMYKEPKVLPILAGALKRMDYPRSKLDIKLVLEEHDHETIKAAKALSLDATFEIVRVPKSHPQTKPKACNYALRLARGEFLTIYDAEDKPEPDQLKKAIVAFRKLGPKTACIQAHLNYFNVEENWLTRMFTLEYSLWFDMFLPALDRLHVPIPLGGTSNHFDLQKLREAGAWDPFNVTEDADLGLRFAAMGYRVGVVNSVTLEEANSAVANWIRQRSRWVKGYIQTWLVNMRHPIKLWKKVGWRGFCSFQLLVGGTILSGLIFPWLVIPFIVWMLTRTTLLGPFFPAPILAVSSFNLIIGNSCLVYLSMLAVAKRKHRTLLPYALTVPGYWALQSVASYKGLWQLVENPFFWEKTEHGISKFTQAEVASALSVRP